MERRTILPLLSTLLALATLTSFGCRPDVDRTCEQLTADKIPFPADWATPEFMESQANAYILCLPDNVAEDSELIDSLVCTLLPEHLAEIPVFFLSLYRESHITNIDRLSTDFYGTYDHIEKDLLYIYEWDYGQFEYRINLTEEYEIDFPNPRWGCYDSSR